MTSKLMSLLGLVSRSDKKFEAPNYHTNATLKSSGNKSKLGSRRPSTAKRE